MGYRCSCHLECDIDTDSLSTHFLTSTKALGSQVIYLTGIRQINIDMFFFFFFCSSQSVLKYIFITCRLEKLTQMEQLAYVNKLDI